MEMIDYTEVALRGATVGCSDGGEWLIDYVPAGAVISADSDIVGVI